MLVFSPQKSFSHLLILVSVVVSIIGFTFPDFQRLFWLSGYSLYSGAYINAIVQIILFQFLHGNILHLLMNSYFLYTAGPEVEVRMSPNRYIWFFVTSTIFVAIALFILQPGALTIGISGFCMALLSYLWIDLYTTRHPMASQILIMLIVNIGIWLVPGISLIWHLFGAIWWLIWWTIRKKF